MQNNTQKALVSFENPETKAKIILDFMDDGKEVNFEINYENIDENTETDLSGKLAMLFLEFCNSLNNEG